MKVSIICISFFIYSFTFGQQASLQKLWVGDTNNYLKIDTALVCVEFWFTYNGKVIPTSAGSRYSLIGDTLRIFTDEIKKTENNDFIRTPVNHDFIITRATDDELKLHSLGPNSWLLAFNGGPDPLKDLTYRSQPKIYTDTIHFEKILFKTVPGPWGGPRLSVQIDSTKQVKYIGDGSAALKGFYAGTLSDHLFAELLNILAISDLDNWAYSGHYNVDVLASILEVHYNNKVRFIKSYTRRMPLMAQALGDFMFDIPNHAELKKADLIEIPFSQ